MKLRKINEREADRIGQVLLFVLLTIFGPLSIGHIPGEATFRGGVSIIFSFVWVIVFGVFTVMNWGTVFSTIWNAFARDDDSA